MLRTLLSALVVWAGMSFSAFAQDRPSEERLALAREVMVLSGGEAIFTQMIDSMQPMLTADLRRRGLSAEVTERTWRLMREEFVLEAPQFVELGAIAYANTFTDEELQGLAAFLRSPPGRAMVEHQAEIATSMMQAGAIVGEEVAARVARRLADERPQHQP